MKYSKPDASPEEIEAALKAANAWDFLQEKSGIKTSVGGAGN
jgi:ABC-type multidrug transport system fused ATPase/permease subunit